MLFILCVQILVGWSLDIVHRSGNPSIRYLRQGPISHVPIPPGFVSRVIKTALVMAFVVLLPPRPIVSRILYSQAQIPFPCKFQCSLHMACIGRVNNVWRQGANGAASLSGVRITSNTRSVWVDRIAAIICPGRGDTYGVGRVESGIGPVRNDDVAGSLVVVGLRRIANGSGGCRTYEPARYSIVKCIPFDGRRPAQIGRRLVI
jgi:hypothetical protein